MSDKNGWISIHRKIQQHWIWETNKPFDKRSAWIDILLMVNHKKRKVILGNELIEVGCGERITSERKLAERWGWSRTKVRNFLEILKKDSMIKVEKPNQKRTRIKVLNYSNYQNIKNHKRTREEPEKNQRRTREEPEKNINNNDNNDNNDNNKKRSEKKSIPNNIPKPKFDKKSIPYKAAFYLRKLILNNNPRQPVPNENPSDMREWAIEMDRLNRLGPVGTKNKGYSWEEIGKIMEWCQDHHFWKNNILSAGKFREQITKLENQMNNDGKNIKRKKQNDVMRELYQEYKEEEENEET